MPILTACFLMQQGANGGQEENTQRSMNEGIYQDPVTWSEGCLVLCDKQMHKR